MIGGCSFCAGAAGGSASGAGLSGGISPSAWPEEDAAFSSFVFRFSYFVSASVAGVGTAIGNRIVNVVPLPSSDDLACSSVSRPC